MMRRLVERLVGFSGRRPWLVVLLALCLSGLAWAYASRLELRTDLMQLLPRDSPGFRAFERQLGKLGGGATLFVLIESPDGDANRRFIRDLAAHLERKLEDDARCHSSCRGPGCQACSPQLIARVEHGTQEIGDFFRHNRWLYADLDELEQADERIDRAIAVKSGLLVDLETDPEPAAAGEQTEASETELGRFLDRIETKFDRAESRLNPAKSGYFENDDGKSVGLRIVANSTPLGDVSGDRLLEETQALVAATNPAKYHASARVGYAGDIPNSLAERRSLASDAVWATLAALALILAGIAVYFRSLSSLIIVGFPALIGVGCAYAFAAAIYGYVNSTGAFLGAIILGNGINYPIVLLSRYEEFVAAGQPPAEARVAAVWNAFRAELVGAAVASIAYGSLTVTTFRGFSQFGTIGCVGMLFVWCATIFVVPALLSIVEKRRRASGRALTSSVSHTRAAGPVGRFVARLGQRRARPIVIAAAVGFAASVAVLPSFLADPWEYNFGRLGSRASKTGGAGTWSVKAERVFGGKTNVAGAMMLADSPERALAIKRRILEKDAADPGGRLIEDVTVIQDFLPGSVDEQQRKLALIDGIRRRITPRVLQSFDASLRGRIESLLPSSELLPIRAENLPRLLRSQFQDRSGALGTVFYVRYQNHVVLSNGKNLLRIAALTDDIELPDGTHVQTASRATIFAEMIRSMERDGPLASGVAFAAVLAVVLIATHTVRGAFTVIACLLWGVCLMLALSAVSGERLNFVNFIAIPITLGIGCEYPFNVYDRSRLLGGDVVAAVERAGMAVALCSYTTVIGYASLLFADSQALQSFGRMAIVGELACTVGALLLLPALLHLGNARRLVHGSKSAG